MKGKTLGDKARFGKGGVEYVAFIGLRSDEPHRVERVETRNEGGSGYEGEHVYMPLDDMAITRDDVNRFWESQDWDLALPKETSLSNCVFCFLKGLGSLNDIRERMDDAQNSNVEGFGTLEETPSDLAWWARVELKYGRDLEAEGREVRSSATRIGFFGSDEFTYENVAEGTVPGELTEGMLPCDCTE